MKNNVISFPNKAKRKLPKESAYACIACGLSIFHIAPCGDIQCANCDKVYKNKTEIRMSG